MALNFDRYGRVIKPGVTYSALDDLEMERKQAQREHRYADVTDIWLRMQEMRRQQATSGPAARAGQDIQQQDTSDHAARAGEAFQKAENLTAGKSNEVMADPRITAAMDQLQSGMAGPYTQAIQQQMVNRMADQSAAAEAVNAEEIRNEAAAKGLDPTQALRGLQSQRQARNLAFQGDVGMQSTLANYEAGQNAARALGGMRMSQWGTVLPGYGQAANYNVQRTFGGQRAPAVTNSAPNLAFSQPSQAPSSPSPIPQLVNMQMGTQQPVNLNRPSPTTATSTPSPTKTRPPVIRQQQQPQGEQPIVWNANQRSSLLNSLNAPGTYKSWLTPENSPYP